MPEIGWMGGPLEPEPAPRPEVVDEILWAIERVSPDDFDLIPEAAGATEPEWNAALGLAVVSLNETLQRAGWDATDVRRRDVAARIAALQRMTGSEGVG